MDKNASYITLGMHTPPLPTEIETEQRILNEYLERHTAFQNKLQVFTTHLKRKDWSSTLVLARETLDLLFDFLVRATWDEPILMLLSLRGLGRTIIRAQPLELVVGCMVRRVLYLLREEMAKVVRQVREETRYTPKRGGDDMESYESSEGREMEEEDEDDQHDDSQQGEGDEDETMTTKASKNLSRKSSSKKSGEYEGGSAIPSLQNILVDGDLESSYFGVSSADGSPSVMTSRPSLESAPSTGSASKKMEEKGLWQDLKRNMTQAVKELQAELDNVHDPIAKQSIEYIHAREVVLVYGNSNGAVSFLRNAGEKIPSFEVYVAETTDVHASHEMATKLSSYGIDTTVITDSAIFALMARVNKVIIGARAVMANGGILSDNGTNMVSTAAKHHSVPVVCVTGLYKLCPLYPFDQDSFNELVSPGSVIPFADVPVGEVELASPAYDYIAPDKVTLIITDSGAHQPSYIYRLLAEFYSPLDKLTEGVPQLDL